jgi:hypothetical protein
MTSRLPIVRWLCAPLALAACGGQRPTEVVAVPPSGTASAPTTHEVAPARSIEVSKMRGPLVRLGAKGFAGAPTFLAFSRDERFVAASMGMAGAEVELFDGEGRQVAKLSVELERAVRALDFSLDGTTLLVSLSGGKSHPAALQIVAVPEGKVLRQTELQRENAQSTFERGLEGHFLADGSVVARSGGKLLHWPPNASTPRDLGPLPDGAFLSTSPDKRLFVVSTPDEITVRDGRNPGKVVFRRHREAEQRAGAPNYRAFVTDDGTTLFQDRGEVVLRKQPGSETKLGPGEPLGLGPRYAVVRNSREAVVEVVDRTTPTTRVRVAASTAWLSPNGTRLFADSGQNTACSTSVLPLANVLDGSLVMVREAPRTLAFGLDGTSVVVPDGASVIEWDVATKKLRRRVPLPSPHDRVKGVFRSARDLFVMAGDVHRLTSSGLEEAGNTPYSYPKAFVRKDGSTVACVSDARTSCQAHFVLEPGQRRIGEVKWRHLFPLAGGRGFLEGPYTPNGSDLGASKIVSPNGDTPLEETWLRDVSLHWVAPTEDGAIVLTWEGADSRSRKLFTRRVTPAGLRSACALGTVWPVSDAAMSISPDGRLAAIPLEREPGVLLVDVDQCKGHLAELPARPVGSDFSPDGQSIAVGLSDRSVVILPVPPIQSDVRSTTAAPSRMDGHPTAP